MLLISIGYSELNKADPDCGTTFTWATRAFGPRTGWAGGWGIIASDVLCMASLAEIAGQYRFLLFNAKGIGNDPSSFWVLLVGVLFIVVLTYVCYRGIEISAKIQFVLLAIELVMLAVYAVVALVRVALGHAPPGHMVPTLSWFNPTTVSPSGTRRRSRPDAVHLLGLGHFALGERGDERQGPTTGIGRDHRHGAAAWPRTGSSPSPRRPLPASARRA